MSGKTKLEPSRRRSTPVKASADDYKISTEYLESLSKIYQDILAVFPKVDPRRYRGSGLAFQSIYSALDGKYTLAEIKLAAHELELGQAVECLRILSQRHSGRIQWQLRRPRGGVH